jgi:hypothetical protein
MECGDSANPSTPRFTNTGVYVYICRPMYVRLYIRMCLFMYVQVHICIYDVCVNVFTRMYSCTYVCIQACRYICTLLIYRDWQNNGRTKKLRNRIYLNLLHWKNICWQHWKFFRLLTLCSARVSAQVIVVSDSPCESKGKWETCPILKEDRSLVHA